MVKRACTRFYLPSFQAPVYQSTATPLGLVLNIKDYEIGAVVGKN